MTARLPTLAAFLLATGLSGCSGTPDQTPGVEPPSRPTIRLAATLVSPTDITLTWTGQDAAAQARIVEFATDPQGRYTILQFLPPEQAEFRHPDLIPETRFYYRVRPVYGPVSDPVEVALPDGPFDTPAQQADHDWVSPRTVKDGSVPKRSIRNAGSGAAGTPADLKATVMHANGIKFTWTDHASDEAGYLLELKPAGSTEYRVAAVLDPDVNSVGLITLPTEKKAAYRVRAYYYGAPSNVAHLTTGAEPRRPAVRPGSPRAAPGR